MVLKENTIILIDISQFIKNRFQTGIQRVIKEFLLQGLKHNLNFKVLYFQNKQYFTLDNQNLNKFLSDIKNYSLNLSSKIDIFELSKNYQNKVFLELDSIWNEEENKRENLYAKLKKSNFTIINFIYDLIPIKFPYLMRDNTKKNFLPYIKSIIKYSDKIIFDSNSAKSDFIDLFKTDYKKELKLKVVHLGSNFNTSKIKIKQDFTHSYSFLEKKYILFVATIEPRKRQDIVLSAFEKLQKKYPHLVLVFVGSFGWKIKSLKNKIKNHPLKEKNFFHLENIDDNALKLLYKNAFLVTYLSDYEGFGLPIAESLFYNNITIVSNNSSIKEVGKNYVDYLKTNDDKNLVEIISKYLKDENYYIQRKEYLKTNYKNITWNKFYKKVIDTL